MKKFALAALLPVCATARVFAFGHEGHQTVAAIAETMLTPKTKAAVAEILDGDTMLDAATWPDDIKPPYGKLSQTPEAKMFNAQHGDNKSWHFVNFPVGAKSYTASSKFAYPHDVVHILNGCITVLEGGEYEGLDQKDALRYMIHLVGDIHQPLHVIAGYYDLSDPAHPKLLAKIAKPDADVSDAGGNALYYSKSDELHAFWDTNLVNAVFATSDPTVLANKILQGADTNAAKATGNRSTWAAKWAGESMAKATATYADINFGEATVDAHDDLKMMNITLKPSTQDYRTKNTPIIKDQLLKAGVRLAQLLNSIDWDN